MIQEDADLGQILRAGYRSRKRDKAGFAGEVAGWPGVAASFDSVSEARAYLLAAEHLGASGYSWCWFGYGNWTRFSEWSQTAVFVLKDPAAFRARAEERLAGVIAAQVMAQ